MEIEKLGSELITKSNMVNASEMETNYTKLIDVNSIQEHSSETSIQVLGGGGALTKVAVIGLSCRCLMSVVTTCEKDGFELFLCVWLRIGWYVDGIE